MNILDKIVRDTRQVIQQNKNERPVSSLGSMPFYGEPTRSFHDALDTRELAFITEIKKASPSKGIIRKDFDPPLIATQYTEAGTQAISVLTEPLYFQGSLNFLKAVRTKTDRPLLRKDFIFDEYQLHEAKAFGADAVLLIATILEKSQLKDLHQTANELGLDCLVELYAESEIDRIDFDQVRILGVNNRDLRTFEVDLTHSTGVFAHCPDSVIKVSESGIYTPEDLYYLRQHHTDAVLIGESLMRAPDPGIKLKALKNGLQAKENDESTQEQTA